MELKVTAIEKNYNDIQVMRIFIGDKHLCTLKFMEPVLPGSEPRWWILVDDTDIIYAGFNKEEAIENTLKYYGYIK